MIKILDASALMTYLEKEAGFEKVKKSLAQAAENKNKLLMSLINWGEIYYILLRDYGPETTKNIELVIDTFPIELISADKELTKIAASFKATKKLPYADCFAAALAKLHKGILLTCDADFKLVQQDIQIEWLTHET